MRDNSRTSIALVAGAAVGALTLTGCSSSSSGDEPDPAQSRASALASRFGITPIPNLSPGAHGPAGDITTPVSNAPTRVSPGGSEIFPNVSQEASKKFAKRLNKFHGVRTVAYYPQFNQMQVYFEQTATSANRDKVHRYVIKHDPAAAGSPSPTASPSSSPSASAS